MKVVALDIRNGTWYLNREKELVFAEVFDGSTFLRSLKCWDFNVNDRAGHWFMAIEAIALGAKKAQVDTMVETLRLFDDEAQRFARFIHLRVFKREDTWIATYDGNQDITEENSGTGRTALHALAELARPVLLDNL